MTDSVFCESEGDEQADESNKQNKKKREKGLVDLNVSFTIWKLQITTK